MGTERSRIGQEEADLPAALIGRGAELRRLLALVDGIRDHGGALVVRGEAGVGKSALLAAVSAGASAQGVAVFRTTAVESEMRLPFAGLHELCPRTLHLQDGAVLPAPARAGGAS